MHNHARALLCIGMLALAGCDLEDLLDDLDDGARRACAGAYDGADVAGRWTLSAEGERRDCDDASLDGDLSLSFATPIRVLARPEGADGDVDAGSAEDGDGDYSLVADDVPTSFDLSGVASGSCVTLRMHEDLVGAYAGHTQTVDFDGVITGSLRVEGSFTGRGPAGCRLSGDFEITVR